MRQSRPAVVAPLNSSPQWPAGYIAVPREAGAVEKSIPYHLAWVRRFFAQFPGRSRRSLGRTEIEEFPGQTSRLNGVSNRQLAQARAALELHYEQFRGIVPAPRPDRSAAPPALLSVARAQGAAAAPLTLDKKSRVDPLSSSGPFPSPDSYIENHIT
jgi:hypothetical protein